MPYHEVKDPFQTAQDVLFEQLRKAGAEKQRREREEEQYQSMNDYLKEQVNNYNNGVDPQDMKQVTVQKRLTVKFRTT